MEWTTTLPTKEYLELLECEKKVNAYNKWKIYFTYGGELFLGRCAYITTKDPIIKKELKRRQDKIDELKTTLSDTLHKSVKTAFDLEDKIKEKQTKINKLNFANIFLYPLSVLGVAYIISMLSWL
jgi:hypothetical protein